MHRKNARTVALLSVAVMMAAALFGCTSAAPSATAAPTVAPAESQAPATATPAPTSDKPATWVADRHLVGRSFIDDQGGTFPSDFTNNPVAVKLKEMTGITIEWQYTAGTSDLDVMTASLAAGDLPDIITTYVDNSSRPEFPILIKAAREGMFTDVAPFLKESKVYSKYFEDGYLSDDTKNNVMFRPEFNGACYLVHINIPRTNGSNSWPYVGGMKIQKSIAEALAIDPKSIKTEEDLYNLLVKIKAGGFKDANGSAVYPLGPRIWGGSYDSAMAPVNNFAFASSNGFGLLNGKVTYELDTDAVLKQVEFYQKLLKEGLIHPEYFTMDATRAEELCRSNSAAIIAESHNFLDIYKTAEYLPLGPLNDFRGENNVSYQTGKSGWCAWAVPTTTKNPAEVVKFVDFLGTEEGKLLWMYGVEGEQYDLKDGKPIVKQSVLDLMSDRKAMNDLGINAGGYGSNWLCFLGSTDLDNVADFGELTYGQNANPTMYDYAMAQYNYNKPTVRYLDGFDARGYLQDLPDVEPNLNPLLQQSEDIKIKAVFAKDMNEAKSILDSFNAQLKAAGLDKFTEYLQQIYDKNPKAIKFIPEVK